ncbi:hypothetical protein LINPERPRIM_LOCUS3961, partial [Linum perenne]
SHPYLHPPTVYTRSRTSAGRPAQSEDSLESNRETCGVRGLFSPVKVSGKATRF